ncbi:MAG TPA: DUF2147 domain-containing protein [Bacteroidales bacterium]|nr:DUF2147 domain-containing protein [Bacteroidales bacterium]
MKTKLISLIFLLTSIHFGMKAQTHADRIIGYYLTVDDETGKEKSQVQIFKATNGKYYGKLVWLAEPSKNGKAKVDEDNPDKALRSRPILGLQLLKGFSYNEKSGEWDNGTIYNPTGGKTYNCFMKFDGNKLKIRGFIGAAWMGLGKTATWTKEETLRPVK